MKCENTMFHTAEQWQALANDPSDGPVYSSSKTRPSMKYPSRKEFIALIETPPVLELVPHRVAGLKGQLNIATNPIFTAEDRFGCP